MLLCLTKQIYSFLEERSYRNPSSVHVFEDPPQSCDVHEACTLVMNCSRAAELREESACTQINSICSTRIQYILNFQICIYLDYAQYQEMRRWSEWQQFGWHLHPCICVFSVMRCLLRQYFQPQWARHLVHLRISVLVRSFPGSSYIWIFISNMCLINVIQ